MRESKVNVLIFLPYFLLIFLIFSPVLFSTKKAFFGEDFLWQVLPFNHIAIQSIKNNELPLWNPYLFSGMPLFASLSFPLFYPGIILFLILPQHIAVNYFYLLHISIAGYFTYRLARSLNLSAFSAFIAGLCYMFSGNLFTLIYPGHTFKLASASLIPLVMYTFNEALKKTSFSRFLLCAFSLALQAFTTHFQVCYYTWITVFIYLISYLCAKRKENSQVLSAIIVRFIFMVMIFIGLTAALVFPFYEYTKWCTRAGGLSYDQATEASLPPEEWLSFFLVSPFGDQIRTISATPEHSFLFNSFYHLISPAGRISYFGRFNAPRTLSDYLGVIPFILAFITIFSSRRKYALFFLLLAAFSLFLSLGKFNPVYFLFYKYFPGLAMFRVPAEILLLFSFSLAILAGTGYELIHKDLISLNKKRWITLLAFLAVIFSVVLISIAVLKNNLMLKNYYKFHFLLVTLRSISLCVIILSLIYLTLQNKIRKSFLYFLLLALFLGDLWTAHRRYLQIIDITDFYKFVYTDLATNKLLEEKQANTKQIFRFLALGNEMISNKRALSNLQSVYGYHSYPLAHYHKLWTSLGFLNPTLWQLLNVKYIISPRLIDKAQELNLTLIFSHPATSQHVYLVNKNLGHAWFVRKHEFMLSAEAVLKKITSNSGGFIPSEEVILIDEKTEEIAKFLNNEYENELNSANNSSVAKVNIIDYRNLQIKLKVETETPSWLVLSEVYYPGWKAYLNGKPTKIYRANYILRAIYLPVGRHTIEFRYIPLSFWIGVPVSCFTLFISFVFIFFRQKKKPKSDFNF